MSEEEREEAIDEFGHAVAARVRKLLAERWPKSEEDGFRLFHDIVEIADAQLEALLPSIRSR